MSPVFVGALGGGAGALLGAVVAWGVARVLRRDPAWLRVIPLLLAVSGASLAGAFNRSSEEDGIVERLDAIPWVAVLKADYPQDYAQLRRKVRGARTGEDARRALLETSVSMVRRQLPLADPETAAQIYAVQRDEGRALQKIDVAGCAAFLDGRGAPPTLSKAITADLAERESASVVALLRQSETRPASPAVPMRIEDLAQVSLAATSSFTNADQDLVIDVLKTARDPKTADEARVMCAYHLAVADYLLSKPAPDRGRLIRSLWALYRSS